MTALKPNQITVEAVSERGCTCSVNGENSHITWDALFEAASQEDEELSSIYRKLLTQARKMVEGNRSLPITCSVQQNETNVWWVARFTDVAGESSWIPRAADEGGTVAHRWMAEAEAQSRAESLRKLGYRVYGA